MHGRKCCSVPDTKREKQHSKSHSITFPTSFKKLVYSDFIHTMTIVFSRIVTFNDLFLTVAILFKYTCSHHRISIAAYAVEQQWWQSGVPKNEMSLMSFMLKNYARSFARRVTMWLYVKNCWHARTWSSISFWHWQHPSYGDFSFPRFVGLLILSLWFTPSRIVRNNGQILNQVIFLMNRQ
jgi:hypothetical protein